MYQSDANVSRAREYAIDEIARTVLNDFQGREGWQPAQKPAKP